MIEVTVTKKDHEKQRKIVIETERRIARRNQVIKKLTDLATSRIKIKNEKRKVKIKCEIKTARKIEIETEKKKRKEKKKEETKIVSRKKIVLEAIEIERRILIKIKNEKEIVIATENVIATEKRIVLVKRIKRKRKIRKEIVVLKMVNHQIVRNPPLERFIMLKNESVREKKRIQALAREIEMSLMMVTITITTIIMQEVVEAVVARKSERKIEIVTEVIQIREVVIPIIEMLSIKIVRQIEHQSPH